VIKNFFSLTFKYWIVKVLLCIPYVNKFLIYNYIDKNLSSGDFQNNLAETDLLLIYEPRFSRIVNEFSRRGVNVGFLSRRYFDLCFRYHLRDYLIESKRNYGEYALRTYQKYQKPRAAYLQCCKKLAKALKFYSNSSIVLLPKFNDDYTLELIQAFDEEGWEVIVYDREGTVTPERLRTISPVVAEMAPSCHSIITYNDTHLEFFRRVFSLGKRPSPNLLTLGNPLTDDWFDFGSIALSEVWPKDARNKILFFAFGEFSYVYDYDYLQNKEHVWRDLLRDIHSVLTNHFEENEEDWLVYKRGPKGDRDYWLGSEGLLLQKNVALVDPNLSANSLIKSADLIIAFQTTAIIDALHTNTPVIYCGWGDNYSDLRGNLINFEEMALDDAIYYADSPEKLKLILSAPFDQIKVNPVARKTWREAYTTNPDGQVAARFVDWMGEKFKLAANQQN
jgi:hypothetical protein